MHAFGEALLFVLNKITNQKENEPQTTGDQGENEMHENLHVLLLPIPTE